MTASAFIYLVPARPAWNRKGTLVEELATMENVYSPAIGALNEPIAVASRNALAALKQQAKK